MFNIKTQQNQKNMLHQMLFNSRNRYTQQYISKILCHIHLTNENSLNLFIKHLRIYLQNLPLIITISTDNQNWINVIKYTIPNTPIYTNIKNITNSLKVILNEAENKRKYTIITINSDCINSVNQSLMLLRCILKSKHQYRWDKYDLIESGISFNLHVKSRIMSVPLIKELIKIEEDIDTKISSIFHSIVDKMGERVSVYDLLYYHISPSVNIFKTDLQYQTVGLYYSSQVLSMRLLYCTQKSINPFVGLLPLPQEKNIKTPIIAFTGGGLGDVIAMDRIRGLNGIKKIYIATPKKRALLVRDYLKEVYPSIEICICNDSEIVYQHRWHYLQEVTKNNNYNKSIINEISGSCIDFNISYLMHSLRYYMITNDWIIITWGTSANIVNNLIPYEYIQKMEDNDFSLIKSRKLNPVKNNLLPRIQKKVNELITKTKSRGIAIVVVSTNDIGLVCTICNKLHDNDSKCTATRNMNISEIKSVYTFLEKNNLVGIVWSCNETILNKNYDRWIDISKEARIVDYMALINNANAYVGIDSWMSCYAAWSMANQMNHKVIIKSINQNALQNCQFYWGIDIGTSSSNVKIMKSFEDVASIPIS